MGSFPSVRLLPVRLRCYKSELSKHLLLILLSVILPRPFLTPFPLSLSLGLISPPLPPPDAIQYISILTCARGVTPGNWHRSHWESRQTEWGQCCKWVLDDRSPIPAIRQPPGTIAQMSCIAKAPFSEKGSVKTTGLRLHPPKFKDLFFLGEQRGQCLAVRPCKPWRQVEEEDGEGEGDQ